jgi:RHS repeat-associated protein
VIFVSLVVDYVYDAFNRRIERAADANGATAGQQSTEFYFYDGNNVVLDAFDADGSGTTAVAQPSHSYLWGLAVDQLLAQENIHSDDAGGFESTPDDLYWILQDRLQSVGDAVNATDTVQIHNDYDAFGNGYQTISTYGTGTIADTDIPRYNYTCQEQEPLIAGLLYDKRRWYDTNTGRFLTEDPSEFEGGDVNLYRYVGNDSINLTDPTGLCYSGSIYNSHGIDFGLSQYLPSIPTISLPTPYTPSYSPVITSYPSVSSYSPSITGPTFSPSISNFTTSSISSSGSNVGVPNASAVSAIVTGHNYTTYNSPQDAQAQIFNYTPRSADPAWQATLAQAMPAYDTNYATNSVSTNTPIVSDNISTTPIISDKYASPVKDPRDDLGFWGGLVYPFTQTNQQYAQAINAERDKRLLEGGEQAINTWYDRDRYNQLTMSVSEYEAWNNKTLQTQSTPKLGKITGISPVYYSESQAIADSWINTINNHGIITAIAMPGGLGENALLMISGATAGGVPGIPRGQFEIVETGEAALHRPYIRQWVRAEVDAKALRTEDGRYIDPFTLEPFNGKPVLGHVPGNEYWRELTNALEEGLSQKEFNNRMNNPALYQYQSPTTNRNHQFEYKGE